MNLSSAIIGMHNVPEQCLLLLFFLPFMPSLVRSISLLIWAGRLAGYGGKGEHENKVHYLVPIILICAQITNTPAALTHTSAVIALQS